MISAVRGRWIQALPALFLAAGGSVRVEFNTAGTTAQDPDLINHISRSYDVRMGH